MNSSALNLLLLVSQLSLSFSYTFTISTHKKYKYGSALHAYTSSKVTDDDESSPVFKSDPVEEIDPLTVPGLQYSKDAHPIPDQPWRRGDTDGCEDPIYADWRQEAEKIIDYACQSVGATLDCVTWGMSQCIISLKDYSKVEGTIEGPEILIDLKEDYDEQLGPDYFWKPTMSNEEFEEYIETHPHSQVETLDDPIYNIKEDIDTTALSAVAEAIQLALDDPTVERRLKIASRHEIILTQPSEYSGLLETQKDFDAHRGFDVAVETRDPFRSNRTLRGKLVARTALDVLINVDDNLVTIPQNFVYQVSLEETTLQYEA